MRRVSYYYAYVFFYRMHMLPFLPRMPPPPAVVVDVIVVVAVAPFFVAGYSILLYSICYRYYRFIDCSIPILSCVVCDHSVPFFLLVLNLQTWNLQLATHIAPFAPFIAAEIAAGIS